MKIYCIGVDKASLAAEEVRRSDVRFAFFSAVGTWTNEREPCEVCGWHWQKKVPPLLVQWEPSSDVIGDFSWDGPYGYSFVVKEPVAAALAAMGFECQFFPVEYVKPERAARTVPFPYSGPKLLWGQCTQEVGLDMEASGVEQSSSCEVCGDSRYTFRFEGIVIRREMWGRQKMFRIGTNGRSAATFVTEEGRRLLEDKGFSNLPFLAAGEILE